MLVLVSVAHGRLRIVALGVQKGFEAFNVCQTPAPFFRPVGSDQIKVFFLFQMKVAAILSVQLDHKVFTRYNSV